MAKQFLEDEQSRESPEVYEDKKKCFLKPKKKAGGVSGVKCFRYQVGWLKSNSWIWQFIECPMPTRALLLSSCSVCWSGVRLCFEEMYA